MKINRYIILLLLVLVPGGAFAALTLSGNVQITGNLAITGALSKGGGSFVIDHPLDPINKLLFHSFVESPDVKNIYDGVTTLDQNGEVVIELPEYFEALNTDFRYQFGALGEPNPGLYIKEPISDNQFVIGGGVPNTRISWQVTGIRHDPYILANPVIPEVFKGPNSLVNRGEYVFEGYEEQ